jgi:hypothetical protein
MAEMDKPKEPTMRVAEAYRYRCRRCGEVYDECSGGRALQVLLDVIADGVHHPKMGGFTLHALGVHTCADRKGLGISDLIGAEVEHAQGIKDMLLTAAQARIVGSYDKESDYKELSLTFDDLRRFCVDIKTARYYAEEYAEKQKSDREKAQAFCKVQRYTGGRQGKGYFCSLTAT